MIEELLDVSRIISGKMRLEVETIGLASVARAAFESIEPLAEQKKIRLTAKIDPAAGPVCADVERLQQVFGNLLSNAVKFTPQGGSVELRPANEGDWMVATVQDTGRGIAPELQPHVFERFRQGDASTTRSEGGLGIGLAIVRHLVELHGGEVSLESAGVGHGTTFRVRLPRASQARQGGVVPCARSGAATSPDLHDVVVLIVEDDRDALEAVAFTLEGTGARVKQASSVREALAEIERGVPDVVVSDIAMPLEDGYSLIRRLRESSSDRCAQAPGDRADGVRLRGGPGRIAAAPGLGERRTGRMRAQPLVARRAARSGAARADGRAHGAHLTSIDLPAHRTDEIRARRFHPAAATFALPERHDAPLAAGPGSRWRC